jgi:anaerobic magnesium-protoporphyrin IX monomethyl ester cyclase
MLTHGYFIAEDAKEQEIMRPYPPLGILYVSAWLEQHGYPNAVFDTTFSAPAKLRESLLENCPKYVGIYTNLVTKVKVIEAVKFIKSEATLKDTVVILGGPEVKNNAEDFLNHGADYLVIGEGEQSMQELLEALDAGDLAAVKEVPGLALLDDAGELLFTPERTKLKSIDELPFPAREKIDLNLYLDAWKAHHGENAISVSTMRGCPYTCKWCSRAVYGLSYRRRSAKVVVDELEWIVKTYNPDTLWFVDDVFTVSPKWMEQFTEEIEAREVKIKYECITRADRMSEKIVSLLKRSGCFRVWIGAESGSQKIIDLMDRRVKVEEVRDMIHLAQANGIQAGTFIMLGYPGETQEDIEKTIDHLKTSNPDQFTITVAYPIKGTELFQEIEASQTHQIDFATETDRDRDFVRTYNRRYYDYAVRHVVNEVNYNKKVVNGDAMSLSALNLKMRSRVAKAGMFWQRLRS